MVDLKGKDKGNISLPTRLQPPDIQEDDYLFSEEHKVMIINMQKAFYEVKIADLEKRIKRLKDRNEYILDECTTENLAITFRDTETANEIAEINREISRQTKKIKIDNEEIQKIEKLRLLNKEVHEKKMNSMQEKYEKTRLVLVSKMKTLSARINALEDFKTTKDSLVEKLKECNEFMKESEEKVKWALEQIDRKFKIAREKMKNDLHERLLNLASDFQIEITKCLSLPVHRLIRENIAIQNELIQIFNESGSKQINCNNIEYTTEMYKNQIKENRKQTLHRISTSKIQSSLLSALKSSHFKVRKRLADAKLFSQFPRKDQNEFLEEMKMEEEKLDFRRRQLEVKLHQTHVKVNSALNKKRKSKYTIKTLEHILYDVKFAASCALKIFGSDEEIENMTDNQLLLYLMNKINKNKSETWLARVNSIETLFPIEIAYQTGDLGFDPLDLESEIISPKETELALQTGLEFLKHDSKSLTGTSQTDFEKKAIVIESMRQLESFDASKESMFDEEYEEEKEEIESVEERKTEESGSEDGIELKDENENEEA